jgi:putative ABC transport system permease protein
MQVFVTAVSLALDSIRAHKMRSFLTLLGVIIGVASVILVGAAIDGLGSYAEQSTSKIFGSESYMIGQVIETGRTTRKDRAEKLRTHKPIRKDELEWLRSTTGSQVLYSPYQVRVEDVKSDNNSFEAATILGVGANLPEIRDLTLVEGRFFTEQEELRKQDLAIIGEDIRTFLFPNASPIGKKVKVAGIDFTVLGLQEKLGSSFGRSNDNQVFIPSSAFTRLYGTRASLLLFARSRPEANLSMNDSLDITRASLRTRFKQRPDAPDAFDFMTPDSVRAFIDQILGLIAAVVVPVTSISLVVGGIVIMNIMLVSVTERTREIGIRKSVGAKRADILVQFLMESIILSGVGGLLGLALGAATAKVLTWTFGTTLTVTATYVILSIFVSTVVGVVSGWYPARRAARLDPIEALRAE